MNTTEQATLASSIDLQEKLEKLIICQSKATIHSFDIVISKTRQLNDMGTMSDVYDARLIAYTGGLDAPQGEWMLLLENRSLCESPIDALADLLEDIYLHAGSAVVNNGAAVGATYNGVWGM
ncbi:hypothetical protein N0V91_006232 [Didymella pomorum]|uniref:Uncharacterized protein n=1 Tax=Didymella pomorum TaxID=749634 RepID=A0A9W8ZDR5_9PLEO|nr:hypothetical protein N0V91_006232 [Didymella pomorum]